MVPFAVLANVLPTLAAVGLVLTGAENVQGAAAHTPARRGVDHRHLAARAAAANQIGAQEKKRYVVRRRADGSQCRVKGETGFRAPPAPSSSAAAAPAPSAAAPAPSPAAPTQNAASPSPSPAAPQPSPASPTENAQHNANPPPSPSPSPAAPASSAAPAPAPAPPVSNGGLVTGGWLNQHSKLGHAWPNGNWDNAGAPGYIGNYVGSKASWYYTWSPHFVGNGDSLGLEYVPMLWGPHQVSDWWSLQGQWPGTVRNALFFNEPNESGQSNIGAGDSVSYWMNDFLPIRNRGVRLGGAATTSAPSGLQWSQDFERLCQQYGNSAHDCVADFVPIHWYDVSVDGFKAYVENYHRGMGNRNLWITEYACQNFNGGAQCSDDQSWHLHTAMAEWFDQQDYVERYSPFGAMRQMQGVNQNNALMNPDGTITSLGNWYIWSS